VSSLQEYEALYKRSIADPAGFWGDIAQEFTWTKKYSKVMNCSMDTATFKWFEDGELNVRGVFFGGGGGCVYYNHPMLFFFTWNKRKRGGEGHVLAAAMHPSL
jgi:hypothetical protein